MTQDPSKLYTQKPTPLFLQKDSSIHRLYLKKVTIYALPDQIDQTQHVSLFILYVIELLYMSIDDLAHFSGYQINDKAKTVRPLRCTIVPSLHECMCLHLIIYNVNRSYCRFPR